MVTKLKNYLIFKNLNLKQFLNDGSCEAEYLGNRLRVFGGIEEEIVDVEVVGKDAVSYTHLTLPTKRIV